MTDSSRPSTMADASDECHIVAPPTSGEYQTITARFLDPNVQDNASTGASSTAPLTSSSETPAEATAIHDDGIDHIRNKLENREAPGSSSNMASERGYDNSAVDQSATNENTGLLGGIKSYLGMGGATGTAAADNNSASLRTPDESSTGTGLSSTRNTDTTSNSMDPVDTSSTRDTTLPDRTRDTAPADEVAPGTGNNVSGKEDLRNEPVPTAKTDDSISRAKGVQEQKVKGTEEGGEAPKGTAQGGGSLEHRDAIPTAGGEKLGAKHWGESKLVPLVPKTTDDETKGVSSQAGQPTDEVRANTASNTGSATGPPSSASKSSNATAHDSTTGSHGKESFIDKVKDKMHMGKHEK